ncbi:MAG: DUF3455 domain-containing protein [Candidatus Sulfotelmatobacter sp.]
MRTQGMQSYSQSMRKHRRAAIKFAILILALLATTKPNAQDTPAQESAPDVPDAISVPSGLNPVLSVRAKGDQIYTCQADAGGKFNWTLKGPDAELKDRKDKVVGQHSAGPKWTLKDGSEITGKAAAHVDSVDSDSVPWLLLNVTNNSGKGQLAKVTYVQRVHTHGGQPPAEGCDEAHKSAEMKSSYTADYFFYAPK